METCLVSFIPRNKTLVLWVKKDTKPDIKSFYYLQFLLISLLCFKYFAQDCRWKFEWGSRWKSEWKSAIIKKYFAQSNKIKQNWTIPENFDICFWVSFDRNCQKWTFGVERLGTDLCPPNLEIFLFLSLLGS